MNPTSTRRLRRTTAALAMGWALLAIVLSVGALHGPEGRFVHPFITVRTGSPDRAR
jgi:preprotein translocase subunit SecG